MAPTFNGFLVLMASTALGFGSTFAGQAQAQSRYHNEYHALEAQEEKLERYEDWLENQRGLWARQREREVEQQLRWIDSRQNQLRYHGTRHGHDHNRRYLNSGYGRRSNDPFPYHLAPGFNAPHHPIIKDNNKRDRGRGGHWGRR